MIIYFVIVSGKPRRSAAESLPPIGVFWDIENCGVPCRKSALAVVSRIRERFFTGHREAEFMCVCDISKENRAVIQELNYAQVDLYSVLLKCLFYLKNYIIFVLKKLILLQYVTDFFSLYWAWIG